MAISCEPADLQAAANCFKCDIPKGEEALVMIYLLQQIAQNTMTPQELANAATCFRCGIPRGMEQEVIMYLLCQIATASGA